ncbi:MAG: helix-turn-helix transcriptional regulator [Candidatus Didemnitutus sp.]|nr:helix-turn-helix transcriptional regulator [Candidatus Didemnitutus sp.]
MKRSLHVRPGLGLALHVVQEGGRPLWRVFVDFPTVLLICAGTKRLRLDGAEIVAHAGEMIVLTGGCKIEVTNTPPATGPYLAQSVSIDPALCAECEPPGARLTPVAGGRRLERPPEYLRAAFARALRACDEAAGVPAALARHQLQELVLALAEHGLRFDAGRFSRMATRVRRLVGSDATRRWRAGAVARQLGMSEATLRRRLEREGVSFRRVLQDVRMGRALVLLQSSELSVVQVALEVGYDSVSQFSARFRRHFGQTPRQLRGAGGRD